jgi:cell division protein FtsB
MNNRLIQPSQAPRQTNWLFVVLALLIASVLGIGVFAYQYWQIREELLAQTQQLENLLEQIDNLEQQIEDLKTAEPINETLD